MTGQIFLEALEQIAADDLHVIEIELDAHVRRADLADDVGGVLDAAEKIVRPVARIDRLDQQRDIRLGGFRGGARDILDEDRSAAGRCSAGTTPAMQWIAVPPIATT